MGASVINVYIRVVMPANRLRVNHYDFMALHSMWRHINTMCRHIKFHSILRQINPHFRLVFNETDRSVQ